MFVTGPSDLNGVSHWFFSELAADGPGQALTEQKMRTHHTGTSIYLSSKIQFSVITIAWYSCV